jgi:FtsP/CotA-like multicopper oxidase with cupredoxin domain
VGEAGGYVVYDPDELTLVANAIGTTLSKKMATGPLTGLPVGLLDAVGIPLVIQDKTFVPKNIGPNAVASDGFTPQSQDAKWDLNHWGQYGDLYFPHVYETNQDPNSADGTNPVGRWDWGPWFWPVFPAQFSLPSGAFGEVTATPEAFMDTSVVNGQAYPTMSVDPKTYRFRVLSVANDRTHNLGLYQAVDAKNKVCDATNKAPALAGTAPGGLPPVACTEVRMVPALPTAGFPAKWPTDGRVGGVPDPATAGPDIVQIGSEGGLLPVPAVWKSQPVTYETNVRSITMLNILDHDLLMGGGERADVLIDFSKYAGQTLILYNDAPTPMPALDPRTDYTTGGGDKTDAGGAHDTLPGYGPNTRTVMQIKVNATNTSGSGGALDVAALAAAMPAVYAKTQPPPIIPEAAYNVAFGTNDVNNYAAIGTGSGGQGPADPIRTFNYTVAPYVDPVDGATKTRKSLPVINKAIQELFDPIYGRMNATLAVELPFSTSTVATTIPLAYVDVPVERLDAIKEGETQIWKVTHNGVDGHPVHFHLVNVQVINRVGWDGTIKPPDANEVGWKETLRMNPLEDVYVAVKAKRPVTPFGVPKSSRVLDPSQAIGSTLGFTNIDPTSGGAPRVQWQITPTSNMLNVSVPVANGQYSNRLTDFDNEYVWHCHILGHEEQDFMRPFIFHPNLLVPDAPAGVAVTGSTVSWSDTTPVGGQDAQGIPTAGKNAAYPEPTSSPKNEIGFRVYRTVTTDETTITTPAVLAADGTVTTAAVTNTVTKSVDATLLATVPANTTSWTNGAVTVPGAPVATTTNGVTTTITTAYAVKAFNAAGDSQPGTSATTTTASGTLTGTATGPTYTSGTGTAVVSAVTGPTGLTQRLNTDGSVLLTWGAVAGATSYIVSVDGGAANAVNGGFDVSVAATLTRYTVPAAKLAPGINHTFSVAAMTLSGTTSGAATTVYNGKAYTPVAFTAAAGPTGSRTVVLGWANDARNVNNVTGLVLTWTQGGKVVGSYSFDPKTTGASVITLERGLTFNFTLVANSANGNSLPTGTISATAP